MEKEMKLSINQTEAGEWEVYFCAKGITDVAEFMNSTSFTYALHQFAEAIEMNGESEEGEA